MSATTVMTPEVSDSPDVRRQFPFRGPSPARSRPARRAGRRLGPTARPVGTVLAPLGMGTASRKVHACGGDEVTVPAVVPLPAGQLRLTERGIALILVAGLLVVIAATTVVGLTALRVTGDGAAPLPSSYSAGVPAPAWP
jgi:hypothetical protein